MDSDWTGVALAPGDSEMEGAERACETQARNAVSGVLSACVKRGLHAWVRILVKLTVGVAATVAARADEAVATEVWAMVVDSRVA